MSEAAPPLGTPGRRVSLSQGRGFPWLVIIGGGASPVESSVGAGLSLVGHPMLTSSRQTLAAPVRAAGTLSVQQAKGEESRKWGLRFQTRGGVC